MTEAPLFEVIPPAKRTYEELVELNHYLNKRCSEAESRLYELTLILRDGAEDRNDTPLGAWGTAVDQLDEWDHQDGYEWDWRDHCPETAKGANKVYYSRDDQ